MTGDTGFRLCSSAKPLDSAWMILVHSRIVSVAPGGNLAPSVQSGGQRGVVRRMHACRWERELGATPIAGGAGARVAGRLSICSAAATRSPSLSHIARLSERFCFTFLGGRLPLLRDDGRREPTGADEGAWSSPHAAPAPSPWVGSPG